MNHNPSGPSECPVCRAPGASFACQAVLYAGCEKDIFSCAGCGSSYYWPSPAPEDVARCYPYSYYGDFLKQYWKDFYKGRMLADSLAGWRGSGTFLDVGCALGTLLAGFRERSGWKVLGLEYSKEAAEAGSRLNGLTIAPGGLLDAPWPDRSVDYVHMNNVLEHESRPLEALRAAARLLGPGGRLHLTLPNGPLDLRPTRVLYRRWGKAVVTRHGGHLFFFSKRSLGPLLERAGLRLLTVKNFHFKSALKARGWTPGAYRLFAAHLSPAPPRAEAPPLSSEECRARIGAPRSWPRYRLGAGWRRLWRLPFGEMGCDLEVFAEKS
ncbi:MAG: hypothetical protein A2X36_07370 [Elusimicrobia bacterium GWA2_69_24]|nr:MAG: hypothetical protein A2X36_07370 [Elusimicrobia bacterium GWA2_69_24]